MNASVANVTVVIEYRDSFTKAVTKNVIVVVLSISINYINAGLIHTFQKNQVWGPHSIATHTLNDPVMVDLICSPRSTLVCDVVCTGLQIASSFSMTYSSL